jgi:prevent-host-death family protein
MPGRTPRVSYGGERIILTSRGKPKAALINLEDYERLLESDNRAAEIQKWLHWIEEMTPLK